MNRTRLLAFTGLVLCLPAAHAATTDLAPHFNRSVLPQLTAPNVVPGDDFGLANSAAYAANPAFSAVVGLGFSGGQYCSGVLVSPTTVLSARHCDPRAGEFANFGTNFNSPSFSSNIQSVSYPAGGSAGSPLLDGGDLAIIRLATPVPASIATPMALLDSTTALTGSTVTVIGYGRTGVGSGALGSFSDGIRRGGTNVMDRYGQAVNGAAAIAGTSNLFSTDFDNPAGTSNTLGWLGSSAIPTPFESSVAQGDSGGPMLFDNGGQWAVLGVLSGGTQAAGFYGDISWWTGVTPFRTQIESAGGVFVTLIPEPGSYALMLLGLGLMTALLRRRQRD